MLGRNLIPEADIAELRDRTDLEALIGEYVSLKRVGANLRGLCPFHSEKSPSFYVHPARQFFHCFGCAASGDAIAFYMRIEGVGFPEAVQVLAERAGMELSIAASGVDAVAREERVHKERLYALMEAATAFYVRQMDIHPHAALAWQEVERRSISREVARTFRLGYAPLGWDGLVGFLRSKDFSAADAESVGLIVPRRRGPGYYDRFRHRLLFPVTDAQGHVVAFSGRRLDYPENQAPSAGHEEPKYVNSPEGPLYHKGDLLFGLHEARVELRRGGWALLCEGNFDLLALHQAGFSQAVAPLGTAFTQAQANLLKRSVARVTLLFDGDKAGQKAVHAAFPLLQKAGLGARVVSLPEGHDPDTFLRERGVEALRQMVDQAPGIVEFLIDDAARRASDTREKADAIEGLGPVLAAVDNPVERRLYVERVAQRFGLADLDVVRTQLRRGLQGNAPRKDNRGGSVPPGRDLVRQQQDRVKLPPRQCELLGAILDQPALFGTEEAKNLDGLLTSPELRSIFRTAQALFGERGNLKAPDLLEKIPDGAARSWLMERLSMQQCDGDTAVDKLRQGLPLLAKEHIEHELPRLDRLVCEARQQGDNVQAVTLTKQRDELARSALHAAQGVQG